MRILEGEPNRSPLRPCFDRRLKLEFHGSRVTSDAGLLAYRELDDALGLTALASNVLADNRTGKNGWHGVVGLLRQSVYGRLAGYEDVNDADRLGRDPAMRNAPPTVPGIPAIWLSPARPRRVVSISVRARSAPAAACRLVISPERLYRVSRKAGVSRRTTMPSMLSSAIRRLAPPPKTRSGVPD